jgi:hypothetical protein
MPLASGAAVLALLLAACGNDAEPDGAASADADDTTATEDVDEAPGADVVDGLDFDFPIAVGHCWGRDAEVELDPFPCSEPHVYEVVGIIEDWDRDQYSGSFDAMVEGDEAMMDACEAAGIAYFGYDPLDEGIIVDHDQPQYWGHEDKLVCSAHSGPGTEYVRDEVVGSYADRGLR